MITEDVQYLLLLTVPFMLPALYFALRKNSLAWLGAALCGFSNAFFGLLVLLLGFDYPVHLPIMLVDRNLFFFAIPLAGASVVLGYLAGWMLGHVTFDSTKAANIVTSAIAIVLGALLAFLFYFAEGTSPLGYGYSVIFLLGIVGIVAVPVAVLNTLAKSVAERGK